MKRHGNLYNKITDIDNIHAAYRLARRGKSWQRTIQSFDENLEGNLLEIQDMLVDQTYEVSTYSLKMIYEPKQRQIYRLPFAPDRIIQHAIMNVMEEIWDPMFIRDSYASRKGRGIHAASTRTMEYVRRNQYCLKCDIAKFYPSIDHEILYGIIERKVKDEELLSLLHKIIYSVDGGKNCPIGNYTSQWFGNLYLNELDQRVKHVYKIRDYIRYSDDFLLFSNDKDNLRQILEDIEAYLRDHLDLKLSKQDIFPVSRGVDFVGYRHFRDYILLRKSTAKRVKKRIKNKFWEFRHGLLPADRFISSIASTKGWLQWANCSNFTRSLNLESIMAETVL